MINQFNGVGTYVVKVASRCNLNCSYCYMYNMGDDTYLNQPKIMDMSIIENFAQKLKTHILKYSLNDINIAFHGGEPLLWGIDNLVSAKKKIISILNTKARLSFAVQSNGVLIDDEIVSSLVDNDIYLGVSLDGVKETHDKFRVDHQGRGSFNEINENFKILLKHQNSISLITVINLEIDPEEYYKYLLEQDISGINLILLEANHDKLPAGYRSVEDKSKILYGKWLAKLFDVWVRKIETKRIRVDIFEIIMGLLMGRDTGNQSFGKKYNDVITIETDGSIETVDMLRITKNGFTRNTLNIKTNEIDDLRNESVFIDYYNSHHNLCDECNMCAIKDLCGGGLYVHRYSTENDFDNPSVYCEDIKYIITHINDHLEKMAEAL